VFIQKTLQKGKTDLKIHTEAKVEKDKFMKKLKQKGKNAFQRNAIKSKGKSILGGAIKGMWNAFKRNANK
jgi:hypothetical protein|tara:strand:- start:321 stop:530 length:210 start_codon:yes stop_codon:yes gene_type:complete